MAKKKRPIWVNGLDPLDPHVDPDSNCESADIGQQFWSWESDFTITRDDIERIGEDSSGSTEKDQENN